VRISGLLVAVALSLVACGAGDGAGDGSADSTTTVTSAPVTTTTPPSATTTYVDVIDVDPDALGLAVVPGAEGRLASDLIVGCHGSLFPLSALNEIELIAEDDPAGFLAAIDPFLANEEGQFWPQDGWHLLWSGEESTYLVAKTGDGSLAWMYLERDGNDWKWSGSSIDGDPCELRVGVPEGMNTIEWRLDPEQPSPSPDSTEIHLILNERECTSGQEIGGRLRGPQVVMTAAEVRIVFVAESPPGDFFDCQGNPDTPFLLELPEALGERQLVDGFEVGVVLDDYVD
jgi:hypothetical protein